MFRVSIRPEFAAAFDRLRTVGVPADGEKLPAADLLERLIDEAVDAETNRELNISPSRDALEQLGERIETFEEGTLVVLGDSMASVLEGAEFHEFLRSLPSNRWSLLVMADLDFLGNADGVSLLAGIGRVEETANARTLPLCLRSFSRTSRPETCAQKLIRDQIARAGGRAEGGVQWNDVEPFEEAEELLRFGGGRAILMAVCSDLRKQSYALAYTDCFCLAPEFGVNHGWTFFSNAEANNLVEKSLALLGRD